MRATHCLRTSRAFTLVELTVVIAVVILLFGLLMPALFSAGTAARTATCLSNLRQLSQAALSYANRSGGRYPVGVRYESNGQTLTTIAWDWRHQHDGSPPVPGPLWAGITDPGRVQQCPECVEQTNFNDPHTGYNYNTTYIAGEARFPQLGWASVRPGLPPSLWRRTETTAVFGDGGWKGGTNKFMRAPMNSIEQNLTTIYGGGQAFRHAGRTNVAYLDHHVGTVATAFQGQLATPQLLREIMDHPRNGFLSDDDSAYDPR